MGVRQATGSDIAEIQRVRRSVRENTLPDYSVIRDEDILQHMERLGRGWVYEDESGIGPALHETLLAWLRSQGVTRVSLGTNPGTRAARFYETAGWQFRAIDDSGEAIYEKQLV